MSCFKLALKKTVNAQNPNGFVSCWDPYLLGKCASVRNTVK